jgi:hypothetical protein
MGSEKDKPNLEKADHLPCQSSLGVTLFAERAEGTLNYIFIQSLLATV